MPILKFRRPLWGHEYQNFLLYIIAINAFVFFLAMIRPDNVLDFLATSTINVLGQGKVWTLLTYAFTHLEPMHIIFNMLSLYFIGTAVEQEMGSKTFLVFYLTAALFTGLMSILVYWWGGSILMFVPLIGASGVIYALLIAYASFFPYRTLMVWGIIPIQAPWLALLYTVFDLVMHLNARATGVAYLTHLMGALFGYVVMLIIFRINFFSFFFRKRR